MFFVFENFLHYVDVYLFFVVAIAIKMCSFADVALYLFENIKVVGGNNKT